MNLFVVLFFKHLEWFGVHKLPIGIVDQYVQQFTHEGETVYALAVGRVATSSFTVSPANVRDMLDAVLANTAVIFGAHAILVRHTYASDCLPVSVCAKNKVLSDDESAEHMASLYLDTCPPIWTGTLRKEGPVTVGLSRKEL